MVSPTALIVVGVIVFKLTALIPVGINPLHWLYKSDNCGPVKKFVSAGTTHVLLSVDVIANDYNLPSPLQIV